MVDYTKRKAPMIPQNLRAGDDILIVTDLAAKNPLYTLDAGYSLTLTIVSTSGRQSLTASGNPLTFSADGSVSKLWIPGPYTYIVAFSKGTERHTVATGTLTVLPDVDAQTTFDGRTQAKRTLDAIEAVIEKRASTDQKQYTIAGRSLTKMDVVELLKIRDIYRMEVMRETRAADQAAGIYKGGNAIWARL